MIVEGTLVVHKNPKDENHSEALPIRNLEVLKLLTGFASRGFVTDTFNWNYHYYILTDEGIKYLRQYLGLPEDIVPATLKVSDTAGKQPSRYEGNRKFDGDRKGGFNSDFKRGERSGGDRSFGDRAGGERSFGDRSGGRDSYRPKQSS